MSERCLPHAFQPSQTAKKGIKVTFPVTNPVHYKNRENLHSVKSTVLKRERIIQQDSN